jgi:hypothetical protein
MAHKCQFMGMSARRNHVRSGKPFSERWAGKIALRTPDKSDRRRTKLAKKAKLHK